MAKLGFDKELLDSLRGRKDLLQALLHMKGEDAKTFLQAARKEQIVELLESLDEKERKLLISEGTFGTRTKLFNSQEIKRLFLEKLSEDEVSRLKLKPIESTIK